MSKKYLQTTAIAIVLLVIELGCVPYVSSVVHVYFEDNARVIVDQRYTGGDDPRSLLFAKHDVPLKVHVSAASYTLEIWTPLTTGGPVVALRATGTGGSSLALHGDHVIRLDESTGGYAAGYRYAFLVEDARGKPLMIEIRDASGELLGNERLPYQLRSRGTLVGVESL